MTDIKLEKIVKSAKTETKKAATKIHSYVFSDKRKIDRLAATILGIKELEKKKDEQVAVITQELSVWKRDTDRNDNDYAPSVRVEGYKHQLLIGYPNKYSNIDDKALDEIKKIIGDDYGNLFNTKTEISVKKDNINKDSVKELITLIGLGLMIKNASENDVIKKAEDIGGKEFKRFFTTKQITKPTEDFHQNPPDEETYAKLLALGVKPSAPSFEVEAKAE